MVLLELCCEVEDEVGRRSYGVTNPSHRRPCPPLYSGRAGYRGRNPNDTKETLTRRKDFLALTGVPAACPAELPKRGSCSLCLQPCSLLGLCRFQLSRPAGPQSTGAYFPLAASAWRFPLGEDIPLFSSRCSCSIPVLV